MEALTFTCMYETVFKMHLKYLRFARSPQNRHCLHLHSIGEAAARPLPPHVQSKVLQK